MTMMQLTYVKGNEIVGGDASALASALKSRTIERIDSNPERLCLIADGTKIMLRIAGKPHSDYPVRESFIDKLLRWHHLNRRHLRKASNETAVSFFNDLLLSIKSGTVRVYIENGDAKTITSSRYSEFFDDDVVAACQDIKIATVFRTDKVLRMDSNIYVKFQPRVGDECGFGFSIFNSETGFHALQVSHYVLRYACTNGMIIRIPVARKKQSFRVHYNIGRESLRVFLDEQIGAIQQTRKGIALGICRAAQRPANATMQKQAANVLSSIEGYAQALRREIAEAVTAWDLANIITAHARTQSVDLRNRLEQSAGLLLFDKHEMSAE